MESDELKTPAPDDAQLEAWLRSSTFLPALPDDGFSSRVLAALPPPKRRFPARVLVCLAGGAVGMAVAARPLLAAGNLLDDLPALDAALVSAFDQLANPALGVAASVTLATLAYVFWRDLRRLAPW